MSTDQLLSRIIANQERLERKISQLLQEKKKVNWVKAPVVTKATGWDSNGMRQARENGYVQYKIEKVDGRKVFLYDIDTIHPIHLKNEKSLVQTGS